MEKGNIYSKLILGTAQFGLKYGINNQSGKLQGTEIDDILNRAIENSITTIDTSYAYGDSEKVLGQSLNRINKKIQIISKLPETDLNVKEIFYESLSRLGVDSLYGYLIHHFHFFKSKPEVWHEIMKLKDSGLIKKIGFSIYSIEELKYLLDTKIQFDIIQFPYNILDRQFEPWLPLLKERNINIHVRSTFLQGLFFMDRKLMPSKLKPLESYLNLMYDFALDNKLSLGDIALNYNMTNPFIDGVLIGVDNSKQLIKNIGSVREDITNEVLYLASKINVKEKELLNPVNWK